MTTNRNDIMAQAVFLAQLQAARNNCQCNVCKILRKASDSMTASFLAETPGSKLPAVASTAEEINLEPEAGGE